MPATEQRVSLPPRYRVVRHIANGGMASVWAAEDELLGRLVAVKVLSPAYDSDERARRRFLREARAAARLGDCRHVVTVYDIGEHEDRAFIVMEHFAGGTVADRLRRGRRIPRPLALRWLRETAIALDCAHDHDVVHRDVKPANLLLDDHGRLAVGDFGIATVASEASVTQTGQVLGTAAYISPEQARGFPATAASDRYALAIVAFELLTGARPFNVDHPAAQARAHVQATVPAASDVSDDLPPGVDAALRAGMAKDPDARPPSAEDLVDLLEDALGDDATAVAPPTAATRRIEQTPPPPAPPPAPAADRPRRWPAVAALAALLLAIGAVAAIALTGGGGSGTSDRTTARTPTGGTSTTEKKQRTTSSGSSSSTTTSPRTTSTQAQGTQSTPSTTGSTAASPPPPPAATGEDPKTLNDRGFALITRGNPAAAVPLLETSVLGFRQQGRTAEIDYAFALFNLATALRATGHPDLAIPLLQERLQRSDYKRGVVERELALARQQAGQAPSANGNGNGQNGDGNSGRGDHSGPGRGGGDD
jgi:eukaryotic-like serine/threonine-protein kinase